MFDELDVCRDRDTVFMREAIDQRILKTIVISDISASSAMFLVDKIRACLEDEVLDIQVHSSGSLNKSDFWSNGREIDSGITLYDGAFYKAIPIEMSYPFDTPINIPVAIEARDSFKVFIDEILLRNENVAYVVPNAHLEMMDRLYEIKHKEIDEGKLFKTFKDVPHYRDLEFSKKKRRY